MNLHRFLREFFPAKPPRITMRDGTWIRVWAGDYDGAIPAGSTGPWEVLATSCGPMADGEIQRLVEAHGGPDWGRIAPPSAATVKRIARPFRPVQFNRDFMQLVGINITSYRTVRSRENGTVYLLAPTTKTVEPVVLVYAFDPLATQFPLSEVLGSYETVQDALSGLSGRG